MLVILEGIVMCFILLIICVVGIANGPIGLVTFFEQDVKDRVVELKLTTKDKIKKTNYNIINFVICSNNISCSIYGIWNKWCNRV